MRRKSSCIASGRLDEARNRHHDASELAYLPNQLFAARGRQAVITRPAVVLRLLPFRHYPVFDQHALQGWIERALLHLQHIFGNRSEEHTSELQSLRHLVCRLLLEKTQNFAPPPPPFPSQLLQIRSTRDRHTRPRPTARHSHRTPPTPPARTRRPPLFFFFNCAAHPGVLPSPPPRRSPN